ncbi:hypothetical protein ACFL5Z_08745, partial [Planctomycetota bacterium]
MDLGWDKTVQKIIARLEGASGGGVVNVEGTWGSFGPMLVATISAKLGRPILYVRPHIDDADKAADDLQTFTGRQIETFGAWEGEEDLADATDEIRAQRLQIVSRISSLVSRSEEGALIVPASVQSLCQPVPKPEAIEKGSLALEVERDVSPEDVVKWLVDNHFERTERVDLPGQFARRGGIVDIYAPLVSNKALVGKEVQATSQSTEPVRIEFFGDTVESIRQIDLDTQRSSRQIGSIKIISAVCGMGTQQNSVAGVSPAIRGRDALDTDLLVNILPEDAIIVFEEPGEIEEVAKVFLERTEDASRLYRWADIFEAAKRFTQLHL